MEHLVLVTISGTVNAIVKFASSTGITTSNLTDDGTTFRVAENTIITGSLGLSNTTLTTLNTTSSLSANGTTIVANDPTSSYVSAFYHYAITSGSNARAGIINAIWNGSNIVYNEVGTTDIGSTTTANFTVGLSAGGNVQLSLASSGVWSFKTQTTLL